MLDLLAEVVVVSDTSAEQATVSFFHPSSGLLLRALKSGHCEKNGLVLVEDSVILGAQHGKQIIHIWEPDRDQVNRKIICSGVVTALAVTHDGNFCIGALSEKIHLWQTSTGHLLSVLTRHYQPVTCLTVLDDDSCFVSAGEDNLVLLWRLSDALQAGEGSSKCSPLHTWSHHSMSVRSIYAGAGGLRGRVLTSSLDQTCKLYDSASGELVCSFLFEQAISSATMDASESRLFAGTTSGVIYAVELFSQALIDEIHVNDSDKSHTFSGHTQEVTSLSVSMDSSTLVSGSLDSTCRLWDVVSRQCLRVITQKGAILNARFLSTPSFIHGHSTQTRQCRTVANFKRSLYVPAQQHYDLQNIDRDDEEHVPVLLKDVNARNYNNPGEDMFTLLVDAAMRDHAPHKKSQPRSHGDDTLKPLTYSNLQQRVKELEEANAMLYRLSAGNVVDQISGVNGNNTNTAELPCELIGEALTCVSGEMQE